MPVFTEYDQNFPHVKPSEDLGDHRFSSFEKMGESVATLLIGLALVLIAAAVGTYGASTRQGEMYFLAGILFATIFSVIVILGLVNTLKARRQVHLFEFGIVQTTHKGTETEILRYEDVGQCRIKHEVIKQADRYVCRLTGAEGKSIKFSGYARRYQPERSNKLHSFVNYLNSRIPPSAKRNR